MNNCCVGARVHINFLVVQVHKFYALIKNLEFKFESFACSRAVEIANLLMCLRFALEYRAIIAYRYY